MAGKIKKVVWKDEGDFGYITTMTEGDLKAKDLTRPAADPPAVL